MSKILINEDELRKVSPQCEFVLKLKTNYPYKGTNLEVDETFYSQTDNDATDLQND